MEDVVEACYTWWQAATTFKGYLASDLGTGVVKGVGDFSGSIVEYESAFSIGAPTGLAAELPGVSLRVVKLASRPAGGRRGSLFWPLLENSAHDGDGDLQGSTANDTNTAMNQMRTDIEAAVAGAVMVQKHVVSGTETESQITGFDTQRTVTFLNRRYR